MRGYTETLQVHHWLSLHRDYLSCNILIICEIFGKVALNRLNSEKTFNPIWSMST